MVKEQVLYELIANHTVMSTERLVMNIAIYILEQDPENMLLVEKDMTITLLNKFVNYGLENVSMDPEKRGELLCLKDCKKHLDLYLFFRDDGIEDTVLLNLRQIAHLYERGVNSYVNKYRFKN